MLVKQTIKKEPSFQDGPGHDVSEADVVALDQELARLKDQKDHLCTTSVFIELITPAGGGKFDQSQYSDGSCFGLAVLNKVLP